LVNQASLRLGGAILGKSAHRGQFRASLPCCYGDLTDGWNKADLKIQETPNQRSSTPNSSRSINCRTEHTEEIASSGLRWPVADSKQ
jgi:hypothetical protein